MGKTKDIDIFVSHSHRDKELARAAIKLLTKTIKNLGEIRCTSLPGRSLVIGSPFVESLREDIEASDVMLAIVSPHSLRSEFCLFEMGAAWGCEIPILPVLAPGMRKIPNGTPLSRLHFLQWNSGDDWECLITMVAKLTYSDRKRRKKIAEHVEKFCKRKFSRR